MSSTPAAPPHAQLIAMGTAYWASKLVFVAAQLDLADRLAARPRSAKDLAAELGLHAPALYRFMRSLAGMGVLTEVEPQTFALTPLGEALKKDAPGSARAAILTLAGDLVTRSWDQMIYSLKTGKTALEHVFGKPLFELLAEQPEAASLFSETMVGFHGAEPPAVADAYDFSGVRRASSTLAARRAICSSHILRRHRQTARRAVRSAARGRRRACACSQARGMADRVTIESGSFFETRAARAMTPTCSRTSFTTGPRSSA